MAHSLVFYLFPESLKRYHFNWGCFCVIRLSYRVSFLFCKVSKIGEKTRNNTAFWDERKRERETKRWEHGKNYVIHSRVEQHPWAIISTHDNINLFNLRTTLWEQFVSSNVAYLHLNIYNWCRTVESVAFKQKKIAVIQLYKVFRTALS